MRGWLKLKKPQLSQVGQFLMFREILFKAPHTEQVIMWIMKTTLLNRNTDVVLAALSKSHCPIEKFLGYLIPTPSVTGVQVVIYHEY